MNETFLVILLLAAVAFLFDFRKKARQKRDKEALDAIQPAYASPPSETGKFRAQLALNSGNRKPKKDERAGEEAADTDSLQGEPQPLPDPFSDRAGDQ